MSQLIKPRASTTPADLKKTQVSLPAADIERYNHLRQQLEVAGFDVLALSSALASQFPAILRRLEAAVSAPKTAPASVSAADVGPH